MRIIGHEEITDNTAIEQPVVLEKGKKLVVAPEELRNWYPAKEEIMSLIDSIKGTVDYLSGQVVDIEQEVDTNLETSKNYTDTETAKVKARFLELVATVNDQITDIYEEIHNTTVINADTVNADTVNADEINTDKITATDIEISGDTTITTLDVTTQLSAILANVTTLAATAFTVDSVDANTVDIVELYSRFAQIDRITSNKIKVSEVDTEVITGKVYQVHDEPVNDELCKIKVPLTSNLVHLDGQGWSVVITGKNIFYSNPSDFIYRIEPTDNDILVYLDNGHNFRVTVIGDDTCNITDSIVDRTTVTSNTTSSGIVIDNASIGTIEADTITATTGNFTVVNADSAIIESITGRLYGTATRVQKPIKIRVNATEVQFDGEYEQNINATHTLTRDGDKVVLSDAYDTKYEVIPHYAEETDKTRHDITIKAGHQDFVFDGSETVSLDTQYDFTKDNDKLVITDKYNNKQEVIPHYAEETDKTRHDITIKAGRQDFVFDGSETVTLDTQYDFTKDGDKLVITDKYSNKQEVVPHYAEETDKTRHDITIKAGHQDFVFDGSDTVTLDTQYDFTQDGDKLVITDKYSNKQEITPHYAEETDKTRHGITIKAGQQEFTFDGSDTVTLDTQYDLGTEGDLVKITDKYNNKQTITVPYAEHAGKVDHKLTVNEIYEYDGSSDLSIDTHIETLDALYDLPIVSDTVGQIRYIMQINCYLYVINESNELWWTRVDNTKFEWSKFGSLIDKWRYDGTNLFIYPHTGSQQQSSPSYVITSPGNVADRTFVPILWETYGFYSQSLFFYNFAIIRRGETNYVGKMSDDSRESYVPYYELPSGYTPTDIAVFNGYIVVSLRDGEHDKTIYIEQTSATSGSLKGELSYLTGLRLVGSRMYGNTGGNTYCITNVAGTFSTTNLGFSAHSIYQRDNSSYIAICSDGNIWKSANGVNAWTKMMDWPADTLGGRTYTTFLEDDTLFIISSTYCYRSDKGMNEIKRISASTIGDIRRQVCYVPQFGVMFYGEYSFIRDGNLLYVLNEIEQTANMDVSDSKHTLTINGKKFDGRYNVAIDIQELDVETNNLNFDWVNETNEESE